MIPDDFFLFFFCFCLKCSSLPSVLDRNHVSDMYFLFESHCSDDDFAAKDNGSRTKMPNELILNFFTKTMVLCSFSIENRGGVAS